MSKKRKMNLRKVPDGILEDAKRLPEGGVVAACVKRIKAAELEGGAYASLGMVMVEGTPTFPNEVIPPAGSGRYSKRNRDGREIVRRDLGKVNKTFTVEVPNFGDWNRGSHEVEWVREVYPRDFEPPRGYALSVTQLEEEKLGEPVYVFRFRVEAVFDRNSPGFTYDLLYALNLLQENLGAVGVFQSEATVEDYLKRMYVNWEFLPPGQRDGTIARLLQGKKDPDGEVRERLTARYDLLNSMGPREFVYGTSGFARYFGAKFHDGLVVFENITYGNAIYVMFEDWRELSRRSRLDLLGNDRDKFVRIEHRPGWEERIKKAVADRQPPDTAAKAA